MIERDDEAWENARTLEEAVTVPGGPQGVRLAGRYRVVRQLGRGGMGSVYLAEDTQLDNRQVAIKMLPSILVSNKHAYQQLKSEALVSLKLTHPNIATVRAFEENNGNPFLVVDYVDGLSLGEYLGRKGKLAEDAVLCILPQVAAALDYAHSKGIVHRDVKPGNVMISWDGDPYVLDFGIAREIQETMTRVTGKLSSGTLMYMSPEQLNGEAPSPAQDVYSFAAMAYECLTGAPPFSCGGIEYQIMNKAPDPLPDGIGIAASVMAGLAKDPKDRPATCAAVLVQADASAKSNSAWWSAQLARENAQGNASAKSNSAWWSAQLARENARVDASAKSNSAWWSAQLARENVRVDVPHAKLYQVVDLENGVISYLDGVPSGGWTDEYKTSKIVLRRIEPGTFLMGSPSNVDWRDDDEKQHKVTLTKPYYLGVFQVTQSQWKRVMGNNPARFKGPMRPVEQVSWTDADGFCGRLRSCVGDLDFCLPTEAQWEYACRAGTTTAFAGTLDEMAWCRHHDFLFFLNPSGTQGVGLKSPNAWGLYDMHGNVWEWCADLCGDYGGDATDPTGPDSGSCRVLRGGGWYDYARLCRSAVRAGFSPGGRCSNLGFRVALAPSSL